MKISVITPCRNSGAFIERTLKSVIAQRGAWGELEYIVMDGASTDSTPDILRAYSKDIDVLVSEKDSGPAFAINKGLARATGDILCWLNADDTYFPGALERVAAAFAEHPNAALAFGRCIIIDEYDKEFRRGITNFKHAFFPFSCRFLIQCINYVSQPAMFFRRSAFQKAGALNESMKAAWDYEFMLRLWKCGGAAVVPPPALAAFRWHTQSISGQHFRMQFKEEYDAAIADAGRFSLQALAHLFVRWGIVGSYSLMARARKAGN
ncbi:MAG: glycosyltransferase family 2 protein [Kiritimatiellia bacterium]